MEFLVIVHPAGRADAEGAARYWTEVPALAACTSDGETVEQAIERLEDEIARWLWYAELRGQANVVAPRFALDVQLAF